MKILIVDDSSTIRSIVKRELEPSGYQIIEAANGKEALDKICGEPVDLITLDVDMPVMNGYEACQKFRSTEYRDQINQINGCEPPVIFLTAHDTLEDREKGFEAGAADFITKPFIPGELLNSVNRLLKPQTRYLGMCVLVVDDSSTVRFVLSDILKNEGLEVIEAANGKEAYDILQDRREEIDLIVTDIVMPVMNGEELCLKIRSDLNLKDVPIFFLTALPEKSYILRMFKAGATDHLPKPFLKEELLARLYVHLNNHAVNLELNAKVRELKKLNKFKSDFLAACSHDLRSPLNAIIGFSDLLMEGSDAPEDIQNGLNHIHTSAHLMLSLINNILNLSSLESQEDFEINPAFIVSLARSSFETMKHMAAPKEVAMFFISNLPENLSIPGNEIALARIFNNLLSNAVKFTPRGGRVQFVLDPAENRHVKISVIDSGIGIPEDKIRNIFRKYSSSSRSGTEGELGTGLGLPITKQLVEKLRGSISITSSPGNGTCIQITFPTISNP